MSDTTTIHQGHAVPMLEFTDHVNTRMHGGARLAYFVHVSDMVAGEAYEIPRPILDKGNCAFVVAGCDGELMYHEGQDVIAYVPSEDITGDMGMWRVLAPDADTSRH